MINSSNSNQIIFILPYNEQKTWVEAANIRLKDQVETKEKRQIEFQEIDDRILEERKASLEENKKWKEHMETQVPN